MNAFQWTTALALAASLSATSLHAQTTVQTIVNSGPTSNRYDVVILGDGYRAVEQAKFDNDALRVTAALFNDEPYATFAGYFNVHTVFRASNQSGADQPDITPPIVRDTVYDATYNTGGTPRCLYIRNTSQASADAALAPANEGRVVVLVNDTRYGGCAANFAVSYTGSSMEAVQIHELGHSVGGLADEYDYGGGTVYTGSEPGQPNATKSSTGAKWSQWIGFNSVGAYEGCRYFAMGLFRPWPNCIMRGLGRPHCPICREAIVKVANAVVSTIDAPQPATPAVSAPLGTQQVFSFSNLAPASSNAVVTWTVDGTPQAATGSSLTVDTNTLSLGNHIVRVEVQDNTAFVRNDPNNTLLSSFTWTLSISGPPRPDLIIPALTGSPITLNTGDPFTITTTVRNDGSIAAGSFVVEHFLSDDTALQTSDIYLGGYAVNSLGAATSATNIRTVDLPARLTRLGLYRVIAVVDRTNSIVESNEANNERIGAMLLGGRSCDVKLEYRDELHWPLDDAEVDGMNGGTISPTIVAPCAPAGTQYLIAWGCSGTSPGTMIPGGPTVPINSDFCTQLGLSALNTPIFDMFFGVLDQDGIGRATFDWPGFTLSSSLQGHFAAVLINPGVAFTDTSNTVQILVRR